MWRGGSHPAAFFVPPGHSPARVRLASRESRDSGATGRDRIVRQRRILSRIGSHATTVPMIQSMMAALFSTLSSSNSNSRRATRQALSALRPAPPMGSKGSGSEPDATLRSNSSSAPVSAEWLDASSRSARQSRRSPGAFEPALELSRFRSVSWRGTGHAGPLSVRPPPRAA